MCNEKVDENLLYLAGLFDGEGSAMIVKREPTKYVYAVTYCPVIGITMCDPEPIFLWAEYFMGYGGRLFITERGWPRKPKNEWQIVGRPAGRVAKILLPHTKIRRKQEALQCVIDVADTMRTKNHGSNQLNAEIRAFREDMYFRCKKLNAKGIDNIEINKKAVIGKVTYTPKQLSFLEITRPAEHLVETIV